MAFTSIGLGFTMGLTSLIGGSSSSVSGFCNFDGGVPTVMWISTLFSVIIASISITGFIKMTGYHHIIDDLTAGLLSGNSADPLNDPPMEFGFCYYNPDTGKYHYDPSDPIVP